MIHITCNMCSCDLPDMYARGPQARVCPRAAGPRAYISGKSLVPMLQLLHVVMYIHDCKPIIPLYGIANMCNVYTVLYVHVVSYILVTSLILGLYMK